MNEARWFTLCMASGGCLGIGILAIGFGEWLLSPPFLLAGLWYGRAALKEDGAL